MELAFGYTRISSEEQSNFSLAGQKSDIQNYALKHGYNIVGWFEDDGVSAKDFNRPAWKELVQQLKHRKEVKSILVLNYTRLIRNAGEGLTLMRDLEKNYGVRIVSIHQNMFVTRDDPYSYKFVADMFVNAEYERLVIGANTKFGRWQAQKQGRYLGKAPIGYYNARDERNKPIINIDDETGWAVKQIFTDYLQGISLSQIKRRAIANGLVIKGHSGIPRILANPVYAGFIIVKAYKQEPQQLIRGLHIPLIDESTFFQVQATFNTQRAGVSIKEQEALPLRGAVRCPSCQKLLTGGKSKSKTGRYYWYYTCRECEKININADQAHAWLRQILNHIRLDANTLQSLKTEAFRLFKQELTLRQQRHDGLIAKIATLQQKQHALEEKYLEGAAGKEMFMKWRTIYAGELKILEDELSEVDISLQTTWAFFEEHLHLLDNLVFLFDQASFHNKNLLIRQVFNQFPALGRGGFELSEEAPLLQLTTVTIKELPIIKKGNNSSKKAIIPVSTLYGNVLELLKLLKNCS